jgi:hypothetical protein
MRIVFQIDGSKISSLDDICEIMGITQYLLFQRSTKAKNTAKVSSSNQFEWSLPIFQR